MGPVNLDIKYNIKLKSPFHIGTGYSKGLIDRAIMKDRRDRLYIPGSVIKGNVRNIAEEIAKNFEIDVCSPHADESESLRCFGFNPCLICRIFGSRRNQGGLYFEDAALEDDYKKLLENASYLQTQDRTRTKVSRKLQSVQKGALFTTEYGIGSLVFSGRIWGFLKDTTPIEVMDEKIPMCYELVFLLVALRSFERMGGDRSVGAGWIEVDIDPSNEKFEDKIISYAGQDVPLDFCFHKDHLEAMILAADERKEVLSQ